MFLIRNLINIVPKQRFEQQQGEGGAGGVTTRTDKHVWPGVRVCGWIPRHCTAPARSVYLTLRYYYYAAYSHAAYKHTAGAY